MDARSLQTNFNLFSGPKPCVVLRSKMKNNSLVMIVALIISTMMSVGFVSISPKVIYGDDNRLDIYQVEDQNILLLADATVALISKDYFRDNGFDGFNLKNSKYGKSNNLCSEESFYQQPSLAGCSGVLIAEDLIATAGHCVNNTAGCKRSSFVFDYKMTDSNTPPIASVYENVYNCKEIVKRELSETVDYAIIRLDRPVKKRIPVKLQHSSVQEGDELFVIGHPAGLPTKFADGAKVRTVSSTHFSANLDTYEGNSGSAVFNAKTLEMVGVLVRGSDDFIYDRKRKCYVSNHCTDDNCDGEEVTHASYLEKALKEK